MKAIRIEAINVGAAQEDDKQEDYGTIMIMCLNKPPNPRDGWDATTMRKRLKLIDRIEGKCTIGEDLVLEDAEWEELKTAVSAMMWGIAHKDILAFIDAVEGAKDVGKAKVSKTD